MFMSPVGAEALQNRRSPAKSHDIFYFDLLHDRPDMGGVVQFSTVLLRSLQARWGRRVVPVSTLRQGPAARTSMEAFAQETAMARSLADRHPQATFLFPHFHSPLTRRGSGHRVVNIVHDVQFKSCPDLYSAVDLAALDAAHRQTQVRADDVLFDSEASRTDFIRHFGAPRRHAVIGAPVETRPTGRTTADAAPYLLATSHNSHHPHKNLEGLFDLFARLAAPMPGLQLRMTGFGGDVVAAHLARLPAGLAARVHHHGFVTRHQLDDLYSGATAFASLSRFEGFNLSAAEAAVHGVPLLLSDIPVHRELFGEMALFTSVDTPVEAILAHIERKTVEDHRAAWAHRDRCTPAAVAHAVLERIEALQGPRRDRHVRRIHAGGAHDRLKSLLLSSLAVGALVVAPTGVAWAINGTTVLTHGGSSGDGTAGGNYDESGTDAPGTGGGGGGGPGPGPATTGGTAGANGGAGSIGGVDGLTDGPTTTTTTTTGGTGGTGGNGNFFGGGGGAGGYGQVFTTTVNVTNAFTQLGGVGGNGGTVTNNNQTGGGGGGGGGLLLIQGGTVTNAGAGNLLGNLGGAGGRGGTGGAGLETSGSSTLFTATIDNAAAITGGRGGEAYFGTLTAPVGTPGVGGAGVALVGGGAVNNLGSGAITGGAGGTSGAPGNGANYTGFGGAGGSGIDLYVGGTLSDAAGAHISGGAGAVGIPSPNPGNGNPPSQSTNGGAGGVGTNLLTGGLTFSAPNLGTIAGGAGGAGGGNSARNGAGGRGGDAILLNGSGVSSISNGGAGLLQGGSGGAAGNSPQNPGYVFLGRVGGDGGYGLNSNSVTNALTLTNAAGGIINGGDGGTGGATEASFVGTGPGTGGNGGIGVLVGTSSGTTFTNVGTITGGNGGTGGAGYGPVSGADGGAGGIGAEFLGTTPVTVTNTGGAIIGGNGGVRGTGVIVNGTAGVGGTGIVGGTGGLTIENTGGTLQGGVAGNGTTQALAVAFGGGVNSISTGGTISGGIFVGGGSFQPALTGSAVGPTLTVSGPLAFAAGTTFNIRLTPTSNDSVTLAGPTGTAQLLGAGQVAASVNVAAGAGTYTAGRRTILTSGIPQFGPTFTVNGVANEFNPVVTTNLAFLTPTLAYDPTHVYLDIAGNAVAAPGGIDYTTAASTQNQIAVAGSLTNASNLNGNSGPVLNALNQLTVSQARAAFDSLSGEGITATQNLANRSDQLFVSSIFDQTAFYGTDRGGNAITLTAPQPGFLAIAPADQQKVQPIRELADLSSTKAQPIAPEPFTPQRTWRAWGTGYGGSEDINGNASPVGSAAQNNTIYGGAVGVDYQLTPNYLVGVAVGGSDGAFNVPNRLTFGSTTGGQIAFYDIARFGAFYGASSTSASFYQNRTTRTVAGFGGLATEIERGNFSSHEFRSRLEFGRDIAGYGGSVTPFVALEIAELRSNGFGEQTVSGPGLFALNVSGQSSADVPAFVGLRIQRATPLGNGVVLSPTLQAAYTHEFAPYRQQFAGIASLPGATFLVNGAQPGRNAAQVKTGVQIAIGANTIFYTNFEGEFSGASQFYAGKGGFKYLF